MRLVLNFLIGLLFGGGLIVSGMVNPAKVLGFLDLFGDWDPSLAFVMGGAVLVTTIGYRIVFKRPQPWFAEQRVIPGISTIDRSLIVGPVLFGIGWGLVGLCPGPGFAALLVTPAPTALFMISMLFGMWVARSRAVTEFANHYLK